MASGIVNFETGTSVRAEELVAHGNIGIGTHAQTANVHCVADAPVVVVEDKVGNSTQSALRILADGGTTHLQSGVDLSSDSKGSFKFQSMLGATTHMSIDGTNSHIGIGTESPTNKLHIQWNAGDSTGELVKLTDSTRSLVMGVDSNHPWVGTSSAHDLRLVTNNNARIHIKSDGHVHLMGTNQLGIGYSGGALPGTTSLLNTKAWSATDDTWEDMWHHAFDANWNLRMAQYHDHGVEVKYGIRQRYNSVDYTPITFRGSTMELSGNVGIGTANPFAKLVIGSSASGSSDIDTLGFRSIHNSAQQRTGYKQRIGFYGKEEYNNNERLSAAIDCIYGDNVHIPTYPGVSSTNLAFTVHGRSGSPYEAMRIQHNGSVGVNISNPPAKLSVRTSGAVSMGSSWATTDFVVSAFNNSTIGNSLGVAIGNSYGDDANGLGYIWCMRPNLSWNDLHIQHRKLLVRCIGGDAYFNTGILWSDQTTLSTNKTLQGPNDVTKGAQAHHWATYSARYLKENIEPSLNCLDKVKALRAVNYTWKSGQGDNVTPNGEYEHTHLLTGPQTHIGFIADEVAEVLPEVCTFDPDGVASSLDYARITPVLVNAVKELDEKIGKGENSSDDRLKDNETYVRNATATIMKLKPQVYDKRESFSSNVYTREAGLVAQDIWYDAPELRFIVKPGLMSQIPEEAPLRSDDPSVDPDYSKWGPNPASVEYNNLIPYAIKSIQELSTELPRHKARITGVTPANVDGHRGLIVSAKTGEMHRGVPVLSMSTEAKDKKCFGVISYSNTHSIDNEFLVDATGCGQVWVSNSSPIESGDYLTSSSVSGYAMKQDDDLLRSYTVGKAIHDCDFTPAQKPKRRVVQQLSSVTYYAKTTFYPVTEDRYNELDDPYRFSKEHTFYKKTENVKVPGNNGYDNVEYVHNTNEDESVLSPEQWAALDANTQSTYHVSYSNVMSLVQVSLEDYTKLNESEREGLTISSKTLFYYKLHEESMNALPGYEEETRDQYIDVLDENGQIQWEDDPSGATEPTYEIRYLTADGQITDESNAVHTAALVACTFHCG